MLPLTSATIAVNTITLVVTLVLFTIIMWYDYKKERNQFFALFLLSMALWSGGSLLLIASNVIGLEGSRQLQTIAESVLRAGFSSASVTIYAFATVSVAVRPRFFWSILGLALVFIFSYQLIFESQFLAFADETGTLYRSDIGVYLVFGAITFYLTWRYRARIKSNLLRAGILLFVVGQAISLVRLELQTLSFSIMMSSFAVLLLGAALLREEIMLPLRDRNYQVEAMHNMSIAITSQLAVHTIVKQIVEQAEHWLKADAVGIFLKDSDRIRLAEASGLPRQFIDITLPLGTGISGHVIETKQSVRVENYAQDWKQEPDLPLASDTFGAVMCVPLVSGNESVGALMVIAGKHNRSFQC